MGKYKTFLLTEAAEYKPLNQRYTKLTFENDLGIVKFHYIDLDDEDDTIEYAEADNKIWNASRSWISVDVIAAKVRQKGNGKTLLQDWIKTLPEGTGILINASPLDDRISQTKLQNWYLNQGFKTIEKGNNSLFMVV